MSGFLVRAGILAFAHRGDHLSGPENTMAAFEGAVALGYRYLETDIHCSRDGYLLAFHDDSLDRVTDRTGRIAEMDYAEIRKARVAGEHPIPSLEDLLTTFPDTFINIDMKADATVAPFKALIKRLRCQDRICVGAFSHRRLQSLRADYPHVCTSLSPKEVLWAKLRSFHFPTPKIRGACAQIPEQAGRLALLDERMLETWRKLELPVHVWTINEPKDMNRLIDLGVDGIMTDDAAQLKSVLGNRELWQS